MRILLIDMGSLFWANWHATADQEVSAAFELTIGKVTSLRQGFDHVAVCFDGPPYLRKQISDAYKAQRDRPPPQAIEQLRRVKERLDADGLCIWQAKGFEADDVIATAVRGEWDVAGAALPWEALVIASSDKDLLSLVSDATHVTVMSPRSGDTFDEAAVIAKFGVHPSSMPDLLSLMGDKSDNIPGIPGVGPVNAAKLLAEFGTLEGVLTHGDDIPGKMGTAVKEHAEAARLAARLVALRTDAPIDFAAIYEKREPKKLTKETMDDIDDEVLPPVALEPAPRELPAAPTQALAIVPQSAPPATFEMGLEPQSIGAAYKLAKGMIESRLYQKFGNAEAIWAVMIRGREMGIGALTALDCMSVVEGKPCLSAHLMVARAKSHPKCEYFQLVSSTNERAEYVTKNRDNPDVTRHVYTFEDAKRAGVVRDRGPWSTRPAEMLRKTCAAQLVRIEYPDAALGLYEPAEFGEE